MDRRLPFPRLPDVPESYDPRYMQDLVRALTGLMTILQAPGLGRNTTTTFTNPTTSEVGLEPGTVWDNGGFAALAGRAPINPFVQAIQLDTSADVEPIPGQLAWSDFDGTLNIGLKGGAVVLQVGEETLMRVSNNTGALIANGTAVGFAGVNGLNRIEVAPYLADGAANSLFFVGLATEDIPDGEQGFIAVYGRVRDFDTTGAPFGETWAVGDLLWADPVTPGGLTNAKPTAPNNVVSVAAVLFVGSTNGEVFVRPTIEQQKFYGEFIRDANTTIAAANTAYYVNWTGTKISNGVVVDGSTASRIVVPESGLYNVSCTLQFTCSVSSKRDIYAFFRKDGTLVPNSRRAQTIDINGGYVSLVLSEFFSFTAGDYIEVGFGASDTSVTLSAISAGSPFPAAPAATLAVYQIQQ